MTIPAVLIKNLSFSYSRQSKPCLTDINLEIAKGERFGLFGPNGAGKTTLISLMTGLLRTSTGSVSQIPKKLFGFVPQEFAFYPELTPIENLEFFGAWSGLNRKQIIQRTDELLALSGLNSVRNKPLKFFSGGMKRLINLIIGVIHQPQILFLDEPTVGVDVHTRQVIINYLKELNDKGTTLVYTSHQLKEAEELCRRVALIDQGKIIAHDDLNRLFIHHSEAELEGLFLKLTGKAFRD